MHHSARKALSSRMNILTYYILQIADTNRTRPRFHKTPKLKGFLILKYKQLSKE